MERVECVVAGAGVVGLAVARALAMAGHEVIVLEAEAAIGMHTSSRNSEVIHAGIYYAPGSQKAGLCISGRQALYRYCEEHGVPHRRCGKLIVAAGTAQREQLAKLKDQAERNGVDDLRWLSESDIRQMEPEVRGAAGLYSPSTGIIDSHAYMLSLQGDAERRGASLVLRSPLVAARSCTGGFALEVGGEHPMRLGCSVLVNAAGFFAQRLAHAIAGVPRESIPASFYAKGNYFTLAGRAPFTHLVYPMPEAAGLGVHVTLDMAGQARFGPDVEWIDGVDKNGDNKVGDNNVDYRVDPRRADRFYAAIRSYWPGLADGALLPAYAGIRPKMHAPHEAARDFLIQGPHEHGIVGLVNLYGIESPGLTASLSIADRVTRLAG